MDFTLDIYTELLQAFRQEGYCFLTFADYCKKETLLPVEKCVILRHDVDAKPINSLKMARIETGMGIKSTYYFRIVPKSNQPEIIKQIVALGHEIGYHYEDLTICKGDKTKAIAHFESCLNYFRTFYPVTTICMHGSPRSRFDNKTLWNDFDYRQFGIVGEPYFDTDFNTFFYLTDTGRCWDGYKFSVRDKVNNCFAEKFHTTKEIISAAKHQTIPQKLLITTHPQRWNNNLFKWAEEYCTQNLKNLIKRFLIK